MYAYSINRKSKSKHKINNYNNNNYKKETKKPVRKNTIEETVVTEVQTQKKEVKAVPIYITFPFLRCTQELAIPSEHI